MLPFFSRKGRKEGDRDTLNNRVEISIPDIRDPDGKIPSASRIPYSLFFNVKTRKGPGYPLRNIPPAGDSESVPDYRDPADTRRLKCCRAGCIYGDLQMSGGKKILKCHLCAYYYENGTNNRCNAPYICSRPYITLKKRYVFAAGRDLIIYTVLNARKVLGRPINNGKDIRYTVETADLEYPPLLLTSDGGYTVSPSGELIRIGESVRYPSSSFDAVKFCAEGEEVIVKKENMPYISVREAPDGRGSVWNLLSSERGSHPVFARGYIPLSDPERVDRDMFGEDRNG